MRALGLREAKPFASLSSGLLARKGHASPAMRRQGHDNFGSGDDLGWNDMGFSTPKPVPPAITPDASSPLPEVVRQQAELETAVVTAAAPAPELVAAAEVPQPAAEAVPAPVAKRASRKAAAVSVEPPAMPAKAKAAFTLRLDPARHLRLRLACAVQGRSAQAIVTSALDHFLAAVPEIDALAGQVARKPFP